MKKLATLDGCCPPLLAAPLDETEATELAAAFKALADPVRLRLLSLIAAAPEGTACSCDLEEPVGKSQPTVSPPPVAPRRRRADHQGEGRALGELHRRPRAARGPA